MSALKVTVIFCFVSVIVLLASVIVLLASVVQINLDLKNAKSELMEKWDWNNCHSDGGGNIYNCYGEHASAQILKNEERNDIDDLQNKLDMLSAATGYKYVESDKVDCPAGYFKDGKRPKDDPCADLESKDLKIISPNTTIYHISSIHCKGDCS